MRRPRKAQRPMAARTGKSILLVEADPEQQVLLAHALRSGGHRVVAASSEAGALALTEQFPVDLILVSQELPRTTGIDVSLALTGKRPGLPVVVMASEGGPGLAAAAHRAGAVDCIARSAVPGFIEAWDSDTMSPAQVVGADYEPGLEVAAQSAE